MPAPAPTFWRGKRVLLTGHTGFKGAWMSLWLHRLGAEVTGLALPPEKLSLFNLARVAELVRSNEIDIRDQAAVAAIVASCAPQIVIHMAAQPLVSGGFDDPVGTFATNVMGTVHLLNALRDVPAPEAVLVVTTDKVYAHDDPPKPWREADRLGGQDPYAASKAAAEIVTAGMAHAFLRQRGTPVATARGGNVVGGGDFAANRLVPDAVRAMMAGEPLLLRNPCATRPWQHVLDCIDGYLTYTALLATRKVLPPSLNFAPDRRRGWTAGTLAHAMLKALGSETRWQCAPNPALPEAHVLLIDSRLAKRAIGWTNRLNGRQLIETTAEWYRAWVDHQDMRAFTLRQIEAYEAPT